MKQRLTSILILVWPSKDEEFILYCNDSKIKLVVVLMQNGKLIVYVSRQLRVQRMNYLTHGLELAAVVFGLKEWWHYLYGTRCLIHTDYGSLKYIFTQKELNMRQQRWLELMKDCDCEILYHPWKQTEFQTLLVGGLQQPSCLYKHYLMHYRKIYIS